MSLVIHESGPKSAPTIVLLHGLGVSSWMWELQLPTLQDDFHCIGIDLPGNGDSYEEDWQSFGDSAAQVAEVIRQFANGGKAHVVGLSLGGYVAVQTLADHPDVVLSALASGISTQPITRPFLVRPLTSLIGMTMRIKPLVYLSGKAMGLDEEAFEMYMRDMGRLSAETVKRIYHGVFSSSLPANLAHVADRLLVVAGDKEAKAVLAGLDDVVQQHPGASVASVPNAHHIWNVEHPELFSDMIRSWVRGERLPQQLDILSAQRALHAA